MRQCQWCVCVCKNTTLLSVNHMWGRGVNTLAELWSLLFHSHFMQPWTCECSKCYSLTVHADTFACTHYFYINCNKVHSMWEFLELWLGDDGWCGWGITLMTSVINGAERLGPKGLQSMRIASVFHVCLQGCVHEDIALGSSIHPWCMCRTCTGWMVFILTNRQLDNAVKRQGMLTFCLKWFYYILSEKCGVVRINGQVHVFVYT